MINDKSSNSNQFILNSDIKTKNKTKSGYINNENPIENRINFKLSLRKQKITEKISHKRIPQIITDLKEFKIENIKSIIYTDKDILSGKIYDDLESSFKNETYNILINSLSGLGRILKEKAENENIDYILKADSSYNIKNNIKKEYFPLGNLILKILINSNDKIVYIFCLNFFLSFTSYFDDFNKEIANEKNLNDIFEKYIKLYPFITENTKKNENYHKIFKINNDEKLECFESYKFGAQILKIFGNIFLSINSYESFEKINFYNKIFYLLNIFDLEYEHKNFLHVRIDYLKTIIWLLYIFFKKVENFDIKNKEGILNIIPSLLYYIKLFHSYDEIDILEDIIELLEHISDINNDFSQKIAEFEGINILSNVINIFYKENNIIINNGDEKYNSINNIINRIIYTITNIFILDEKYLTNIDYSNFYNSFEKLFIFYKNYHTNDDDIDEKMVHLLGILACFENNDSIIKLFLINKIIIENLFQFYYEFNKLETLLFIDNIMIKQNKDVRNFILEKGGFNIIIKNICENNDNEKEVLNSSINILFKLLENEKDNKDKIYLEKIYQTSVPEKIKELYNNNKISKNEIIITIINYLENYEKSINT